MAKRKASGAVANQAVLDTAKPSDDEAGNANAFDTSRTTTLTAAEWSAGYPILPSLLPSDATPQAGFEEVEPEKLAENELEKLTTKWEEKGKLPTFSRILGHEKLMSSEKRAAGYLGFSDVGKFFRFLDVEVSWAAYGIVRIYNRQKIRCSKQRVPLVAGIISNSSVWKRLDLISSSDDWLRTALDNSGSEGVLVNAQRVQGNFANINDQAVRIENVDITLSIIAACYKLMAHNTNFFCEQDNTPGQVRSVWGFHHEDWVRALLAIQHTKKRRAAHTRYPHDSCGYATAKPIGPTLVDEAKLGPDGGVRQQSGNRAVTKAKRQWQRDMESAWFSPAEERIKLAGSELMQEALQGLRAYKALSTAERKSALEDESKKIELLGEAACGALHELVGGTDLGAVLESGRIPTGAKREAPEEWEVDALCDMLARRFVPVSKGADDAADASGMASLITAAELEEQPAELGDQSTEPDAGTTTNGNMEVLTEIVSERSFAEVCTDWSFDPDTLLIDQRLPHTRAYAPQIIDAADLTDKLWTCANAAFLASPCGTGKTFTGMLTMYLCNLRRQSYIEADDDANMPVLSRKYKPSLMVVPAATLNQTFTEINSLWGGVFNIYSFYQKKEGCSNTDRAAKTLNTVAELQALIDRLANESDKPETAWTIIITTYTTATKRLCKAAKVKKLRSHEVKSRSSKRRLDKHGNRIDLSEEEDDEDDKEDDEEEDEGGDNDLGDEGGETSNDNNSAGEPPAGVIKGVKKLIKNDDWHIIVADECHALKSPASTINKLFRQLPRERLLLVSATLMPNHPRDMLGYLHLIWNRAWPFDYNEQADKLRPDPFFDGEELNKLHEGTIQSHKGITQERLVSGRVKTSKELDKWEQHCDCNYMAAWQAEYRMHYLHPNLFTAFTDDPTWKESASEAVRHILDMLAVRRGMMSVVKVSDDAEVSLGKQMGSLKVQTIEVAPDVDDTKRVHDHTAALVMHVLAPSGSGPVEVLGHDTQKRDPPVKLNGAVYRRLQAASTDAKNIDLSNPTVRLAKMLCQLQRGAEDVKTGKFAAATLSVVGQAAAGSQEMNKIATIDTTGGLMWSFYNTRPSGGIAFPTLSIDQCQYATWNSPKYSTMLLEAQSAKKAGEKLLVYSNSPLTCQIANAILVSAGIRTLHIMSRHTQAERDVAVESFNNASSPHTCLVTSMQVSATGVNFHKACHRGIILEHPFNMATTMQAIGRLWRVGQSKDVSWKIIHSQDTIDSWIEARALEKYATTLSTEAKIDGKIKGELRMICAYEVARQQLGQETSRYPRLRVPWDKMDTPELAAEGEFYSKLARVVMDNVDDCASLNKDDVRMMAKAWKPGMPITGGMIDLSAPALADGLILGAHAMLQDEDGDEEMGGTESEKLPPVADGDMVEHARRRMAKRKW